MIHYSHIKDTLKGDDLEIIKTRKKVAYYNTPAAFDIETTSTEYMGCKVAFSYIWMIGIGHNTPVYYGRTWEEFREAVDTISTILDLSLERRLVVYVHNLSYEFQFMRAHFDWVGEEVFALDERKAIKAVTQDGIEFRDSYILSGFSLANTAKNLTKYKVRKAEGDLDYSLIRHHTTPLNEAEMGYCENDILVVIAYIQEQIELYGRIDKIPMTNTGRVRNYVKGRCYYDYNEEGKAIRNVNKHNKYTKIMRHLTIEPETYGLLRNAFMGGFTHASAAHSGKLLKNVSSVDFTSSYPSVMLSEMFPMTKFVDVSFDSVEQMESVMRTEAVVMDVKFINISSTFEPENYLSQSKCHEGSLVNAIINNGRVVEADSLMVTLTEVDYFIMKQCYEWDKILVGKAMKASKNYLPKPIIESILKMYQDKTVLKDVEGSEVEYLLSKGMLNSVYGMTVTDIVKDQVVYGDDWGIEPVDESEELDKYNTDRGRFLYYPWGVWITAYARHNLWTGILAVGDDYVYSDTDSLKVLNYEDHSEYIEWFNATIVRKMEAMCAHYKLDTELLSPKTKDGKVKTMGVWDFEGTYPLFKTLGAKRYMMLDNGKVKLTVAGLSKQNGVNYMMKQCNGDIDKVFAMFNNELHIPAESTGKNTHTYIDEPITLMVTDKDGVTEEVHTESGIHLEATEFTLKLSDLYIEFLDRVQSGDTIRSIL